MDLPLRICRVIISTETQTCVGSASNEERSISANASVLEDVTEATLTPSQSFLALTAVNSPPEENFCWLELPSCSGIPPGLWPQF